MLTGKGLILFPFIVLLPQQVLNTQRVCQIKVIEASRALL